MDPAQEGVLKCKDQGIFRESFHIGSLCDQVLGILLKVEWIIGRKQIGNYYDRVGREVHQVEGKAKGSRR